jgi:hypothetical protein
MSSEAEIRSEFAGRITFRPSFSKLASCLRFMMTASNPVRTSGDPELGLALLLAEQQHLSDYGRPVTGCEYAMQDGIPATVTIDEAIERVAVEEVAGVPATIDDVDLDLEVIFSNLSRSDMDYMSDALKLVETDRNAALVRGEAFMIEGRADYALMVEEENLEKLRYKLEDLAAWGRYFHLGR